MNTQSAEILINATLVTASDFAEIYEFVLNQDLTAIECVRVESLAEGVVFPVDNYRQSLKGALFELNHVRVNPRVDNIYIIHQLTSALQDIGVGVNHQPHPNEMASCYKPLGEITENVRFHFDEMGNTTFLCPRAKLSLVNTKPRDFGLPGNL